jgi:hypothetical protein
MQNADFPHWIIYARCGHSEFPQAVNKHSAEISESKEKFSKSSKIQLGSVTQKVFQGILKTQKFTNQEKKATRENGHRKFKKPKKTKVFDPQWSRQFCLWINP